MSETETQTTTEPTTSQQAAVTTGTRARRAFMPRLLIPAEADWITKNVVAGGKGTQVALGRVLGVCTGVDRKTNNFQDRVIESIVLKGDFEAENALTGEVMTFSSAYLPMAYAEMVATQFAGDDPAKSVEIDADIGLEATGKSIPYEWVVIHYTEAKAFDVKAILRARRQSPRTLRLEAEKQAALPAPASVKAK